MKNEERAQYGIPDIEMSKIIRLIYAYTQIKDHHRREMLLDIAEAEAGKGRGGMD